PGSPRTLGCPGFLPVPANDGRDRNPPLPLGPDDHRTGLCCLMGQSLDKSTPNSHSPQEWRRAPVAGVGVPSVGIIECCQGRGLGCHQGSVSWLPAPAAPPPPQVKTSSPSRGTSPPP